jgi:predicted PurR-regulated permease PerM
MGRKIFTLLIAVIFFYIVSPLVIPVVMGGVLATLFFPWLERLEKKRFSTSSASLVLTLGITLVVLIPTALLTFFGAKAGIEQVQSFKDSPRVPGGSWISALLEQERLRPLVDSLATWFPNGIQQMVTTLEDVSTAIGLKLGELLGNLVAHLPGMAIALAIIVVSVYFFLVDGRKLVYFFRRHSVFGPIQTDQLLKALEVTCRSVIFASVISGAVQSLLETLVCLVTGTPNALLIGLLVFLGSFIPVVGSAPVTFGIAMYQLLIGNTSVGVILLISAVAVSVVDNVVRPVFLKGAANLHPLLAFVAAFGGLQTLGFIGIFIGPIVAGVFVVTLQILTSEQESHAISPTSFLK